MEQNPYAPPQADIDQVSAGISDDADSLDQRLDYYAYVGRRSAYYWRHWMGALTGTGRVTGVNFPAFFFSLFWLLYRKLYREFAIACGITMMLGMIASTLLKGSPDAERLVDLAAGAVFAGFANRIYFRRAKLNIAHARQLYSNSQQRRTALANQGGTTIVAPLAAIVIFAGLIVLGGLAHIL